ncbi:hypothetical protein GW17_00047580 [Ensete ventricosum]|nr:hypothetical protein GW17_00047580 [Ensete ventricosum]
MATPPAGGHPTPASSVIIVFSKHRTARRPRKAPAACARSRHVTLFLHASEGDIPARDSGPSSRVLPSKPRKVGCRETIGAFSPSLFVGGERRGGVHFRTGTRDSAGDRNASTKKYPKLQQKSTSPLLDRASVLNRNRTSCMIRFDSELRSVLLDAHSLSEQAPVAETVGKPIASPYRGVHILGLFRSTPERKLVIFYRLQIVERRASTLHLLLLYYFR